MRKPAPLLQTIRRSLLTTPKPPTRYAIQDGPVVVGDGATLAEAWMDAYSSTASAGVRLVDPQVVPYDSGTHLVQRPGVRS